jgi:hypothetical protein
VAFAGSCVRRLTLLVSSDSSEALGWQVEDGWRFNTRIGRDICRGNSETRRGQDLRGRFCAVGQMREPLIANLHFERESQSAVSSRNSSKPTTICKSLGPFHTPNLRGLPPPSSRNHEERSTPNLIEQTTPFSEAWSSYKSQMGGITGLGTKHISLAVAFLPRNLRRSWTRRRSRTGEPMKKPLIQLLPRLRTLLFGQNTSSSNLDFECSAATPMTPSFNKTNNSSSQPKDSDFLAPSTKYQIVRYLTTKGVSANAAYDTGKICWPQKWDWGASN